MRFPVVLFLAVAITTVFAYPAGDSEGAERSSSTGLVRDKRTIGILRDLFPNFSQIIDRKIQMLTRIIFRIVGRLILQGGPNRGGGDSGGDDDSKIQITLPTYPPDEIEDEDEEDTTGSTTQEATTNSDTENTLGDTKKREVKKVKRDTEAAEEEEEEEDLEPDATGDNEVNSDNEAEADGANEDDDPRNKRFLNFNLGAQASAGAGGGGSGNFLFDIIRTSADRAARMAGTVFRVLAGTDDAGLPSYNHQRSLVAGSGNTQSGDAQHAALEEAKDDGVGVPGPLTRLFVVANKGVAALIQDLILRLAQTSERIVNFKAKLITSII